MAEPKILQNIGKLSADVGDTATLNTTSKDLVGAVNELFQNANNGKSTVATAVGLPLQSSDTFSKMGTDIEKIKTDFANAINAKKALADGYVPPDLGNATADKVLIGSTFSSSVGENINGTMANRGNVGVQKLTTQNQIFNILNGFHDGNGQVKAEISNLIANVIKKDEVVGGITGTYETVSNIKQATGYSATFSFPLTVNNLSFAPMMVVIVYGVSGYEPSSMIGVGTQVIIKSPQGLADPTDYAGRYSPVVAKSNNMGFYSTNSYSGEAFNSSGTLSSNGFTINNIKTVSGNLARAMWYAFAW